MTGIYTNEQVVREEGRGGADDHGGGDYAPPKAAAGAGRRVRAPGMFRRVGSLLCGPVPAVYANRYL